MSPVTKWAIVTGWGLGVGKGGLILGSPEGGKMVQEMSDEFLRERERKKAIWKKRDSKNRKKHENQ